MLRIWSRTKRFTNNLKNKTSQLSAVSVTCESGFIHTNIWRKKSPEKLKIHMDDGDSDKWRMCNQGSWVFDWRMHVSLNGSNNIQKLLFSCAGGRCWEILQSMQVVGRERQEMKKEEEKAEESVKQFRNTIRWKHSFLQATLSHLKWKCVQLWGSCYLTLVFIHCKYI